MKARLEIWPHHGRPGTVRYLDPDGVDPKQLAKVRAIVKEQAEALAAETGMAAEAARDLLLISLIERLDDEIAYQRVAAARGVLAL